MGQKPRYDVLFLKMEYGNLSLMPFAASFVMLDGKMKIVVSQAKSPILFKVC